jgi:hypothetical protein
MTEDYYSDSYRFCPQCGAEAFAVASICGTCGRSLAKGTAQEGGQPSSYLVSMTPTGTMKQSTTDNATRGPRSSWLNGRKLLSNPLLTAVLFTVIAISQYWTRDTLWAVLGTVIAIYYWQRWWNQRMREPGRHVSRSKKVALLFVATALLGGAGFWVYEGQIASNRATCNDINTMDNDHLSNAQGVVWAQRLATDGPRSNDSALRRLANDLDNSGNISTDVPDMLERCEELGLSS